MNHYEEAEALAQKAWHYIYGDGGDLPLGQAFGMLAQVHATLASVQEASANKPL
jgi:hypothetical protein